MNQNQYHIVEEIAEASFTINDLKDAEVVVPITSPINILLQPVQKMKGLLRITVDYWKLNQVVTLITDGVADVVSLLKKIYTSLGTLYAAIDLAN